MMSSWNIDAHNGVNIRLVDHRLQLLFILEFRTLFLKGQEG